MCGKRTEARGDLTALKLTTTIADVQKVEFLTGFLVFLSRLA